MDKEEMYRKMPQLFKPGEGGRPKGTKNKSPKLIREAITKVIGGKADKLDEWLDEIADQGVYGKAKAIELIICLVTSFLIDHFVVTMHCKGCSDLWAG
ncbi:MAG: hypothetical protein QM762_26115 [Chryseolinea sp.]